MSDYSPRNVDVEDQLAELGIVIGHCLHLEQSEHFKWFIARMLEIERDSDARRVISGAADWDEYNQKVARIAAYDRVSELTERWRVEANDKIKALQP